MVGILKHFIDDDLIGNFKKLVFKGTYPQFT